MNSFSKNEKEFSQLYDMFIDLEERYREAEIFSGAILFRRDFVQQVENFKSFYELYSLFQHFFTAESIELIQEAVKPLWAIYDEINFSNKQVTDDEALTHKFIDTIKNLPELTKISLRKPTFIIRENIIKFVEYLQNKYQIFTEYNSEDFVAQTDLMSSETNLNSLVQLYNLLIQTNSPQNFSNILSLIKLFENQLASSEVKRIETEIKELEHIRQDKEKSIEELELKESEVKYSISQNSNNKLREVFGQEALDVEPKIEDIQKNIFRFFALMLFLLLCMFLYIAFNQDFEIKRFYIIYLSIFLTLTAYLTYLIKERNRLVKYHHYCKISHNEIAALSDYTAQLNDKEKTEDLKIQLAYRYFQGQNYTDKQGNENQETGMFSKQLNEITNSLKDLKSLIDK